MQNPTGDRQIKNREPLTDMANAKLISQGPHIKHPIEMIKNHEKMYLLIDTLHLKKKRETETDEMETDKRDGEH